jgi:hypothetical protein
MRMFPVDRKSKFRLDAFLGRPDGDAVATAGTPCFLVGQDLFSRGVAALYVAERNGRCARHGSAAAPPPLSVRLSRIGGPVHVACHECVPEQYKNRVPSALHTLQPQKGFVQPYSERAQDLGIDDDERGVRIGERFKGSPSVVGAA